MAKAKAKAKGEAGDAATAAEGPVVPTLAAHPRAARDLLRARGWGALLGFVLVAWLAHGAGLAPTDVLARGLVGGTVGMLAGWAICVVVWRALATAELRAVLRAHQAATEAETERRAAARRAAAV